MAVTRRHLLSAAVLVPWVAWPDVAAAAPAAPAIRPRADWAGNRRPTGPIPAEDVRFLLLHHTATTNDYAEDAVAAQLRQVYAFHTRSRGWADVAYHFFVDRFGTVWEGRTGSLAGPVQGDATGGSQGFAQLCCFLGDFTAVPPTDAAMDAMVRLCAWLADRYGIDLAAPVTFRSRGSNRWRRGTEVTTDPIAGHRDMSLTSCPGDALYPLVRERIAPAALALTRREVASAAPTVPEPGPAPASAEPTVGPASGSATSSVDPAWLVGGLGAAALAAAGVTLAVRRARPVRARPARRWTGSAADEPQGEGETTAEQRADEPDEEPADGQ